MTTHTAPLDFTQAPTLDFQADAVRVELMPVEAGQNPRAEVETKRGADGNPLLVTKEGDVVKLRLPGTWADAWANFEWVTRVRLFVPAHVRARLVIQGGKLTVQRLAGCDLSVQATAGSVELEQSRGRFALAVDSGAVRGEHLGGTFDVRCQAGAVALSIDALDPGAHQLRTTMGSLKVDLAPGLDVKLETTATLGAVRATYPSNPSAKATLMLSADLGAVKVKEGGAVDDPRHGDWPDWRRLWRDVVSAFDAPVTAPPPAAAKAAPLAAQSPEELRRVLELVQEGKLTAADAEKLIRALK